MTKVGQAQTYCLLEPELVVWRLANEVRHHFEEACVACPDVPGGYKCKLQRVIRKLSILGIVVCQECLERFPRGEIRNDNKNEVNKAYLPLSRIDSSMEVSTASMRSNVSFEVKALVYSGGPSVGDPDDESG